MDLPTPFVTQCVVTNGVIFSYIHVQLNTTQLDTSDGLMNMVWLDANNALYQDMYPPLLKIRRTKGNRKTDRRYIRPLVRRDPELGCRELDVVVFRKFLACYLNGALNWLIPYTCTCISTVPSIFLFHFIFYRCTHLYIALYTVNNKIFQSYQVSILLTICFKPWVCPDFCYLNQSQLVVNGKTFVGEHSLQMVLVSCTRGPGTTLLGLRPTRLWQRSPSPWGSRASGYVLWCLDNFPLKSRKLTMPYTSVYHKVSVPHEC